MNRIREILEMNKIAEILDVDVKELLIFNKVNKTKNDE